jgi:hypothetical protein
MLCLGMHSNVMFRFMVQALQDPPLRCITEKNFLIWKLEHVQFGNRIFINSLFKIEEFTVSWQWNTFSLIFIS